MKGKMRKLTIFVSMVCVVALVCSIALAKETTTLEWYTWWQPDVTFDMFKDWVKDFEQMHPSVKVKAIPRGIADQIAGDDMLRAVAAGNPPDVAIQNGFVYSQWVEQGVFQPLDSYIKRDGYDVANIPPGLLEEASYKGRFFVPAGTDIYGIPGYGLNVWGLIWNRQIFREVGFDPDKSPRTWKEVEVYAEKITEHDSKGNIVRAGIVPWFTRPFPYVATYSYGGSIISADGKRVVCGEDPGTIEGFEWMHKFAKKFGIEKLRRFEGSLAGPKQWGAAANAPLYTGELGMAIEANMAIDNIKRYGPNLDYGVGPLPVKEGIKPVTIAAGTIVGIPQDSKHPDLAWEFIKFMSTDLCWLDFYTKRRAMPGSFSALNILKKIEADPHMKPFFEFMDFAVGLSGHSPSPISNFLWNELKVAQDLVLSEKKSAKEALMDLQTKAQKQLDLVVARCSK